MVEHHPVRNRPPRSDLITPECSKPSVIRYAVDLTKVLDDENYLRVIPMATYGASATSLSC